MSTIFACPTEIIHEIVAKDKECFLCLRLTCKVMHEKLKMIVRNFEWVRETETLALSSRVIEILSEVDQLCEAFKTLSLSDPVVKVDDLLITFPITMSHIPSLLLNHILDHYSPPKFTPSGDTLKNALHSLKLGHTPIGLKGAIKINNKVQMVWLTGHWAHYITLSDEISKVAKPLIQFVSEYAEWQVTEISL